MFEKPLEVVRVFTDCFAFKVIILHDLCALNGKITHENSVNLPCGLGNNRNGSSIRGPKAVWFFSYCVRLDWVQICVGLHGNVSVMLVCAGCAGERKRKRNTAKGTTRDLSKRLPCRGQHRYINFGGKEKLKKDVRKTENKDPDRTFKTSSM